MPLARPNLKPRFGQQDTGQSSNVKSASATDCHTIHWYASTGSSDLTVAFSSFSLFRSAAPKPGAPMLAPTRTEDGKRPVLGP
eukprot:88843-Rhodomonas_salina.2